MIRNAALLFLVALLPSAAGAQTSTTHADGQDRPVVEAARATGPIHVDGRLDEPSWSQARVATDFTQVDPEEGRPVSERTEARILYDDQALYIGVRLHDRQRPTMRLGRRDMDLLDSDWLGVVIDSYHDHRTAFSLDVNPAGVQRDAVKSMGAGGNEQDDLSWDAVWDAKVTVDDGGWTAEYRIPFSQLRFGSAPEQVWGIQLERIIGRRREYAVLSFTPKSQPGGIPTYAHLTGLRDIEPGNRVEVLPYAVARSEHVDPAGNPFRTDSERFGSAGVDLLYRVTSDFAVNATINPDFGQVEVDPAVVNLTVYETFFEEKRPFFIEGSEIFNFGRNTSGGQLFYTRRIGRAPQLGAPGQADRPDITTILGAAKLTGKTASGWSVGLIEAVTDREDARFYDPSGAVQVTGVEPLTNYLVARVRKDEDEGRTSLGGMITAVNRDLATEPMQAFLRSTAYSGGMDFRLESASRTWVLAGSAAFSRVAGSNTSITAVQRAGNHFFQRPDADHLDVDPDATTLTGYSIGASLARQGGEHWRGSLALAATSPGFEVNDLGFQTRTDRRDLAANIQYVQNTPGTFLRNWSLNANARVEHNFDWQRILGVTGINFSFRTLNFWGGALNVTRFHTANDDRSTRGGPLMERPAAWNGFFHVGSDSRKRLSVFTTLDGGRDDYGGWGAGAEVVAIFRPSPRWSLRVGPQVNRNESPAQYVGTVPDAGATATYGARYLFAPLSQTTVAMETRLDFTFTPKLSFQLYAQPFISSGDFGDVGSLEAPGTYAFESWPGATPDRDFNFRSLRGTAVLRWEYRPGSTLYFAWQQSREDYALGVGDFDFARDRGALFRARPDNVFVLKASYWITP